MGKPTPLGKGLSPGSLQGTVPRLDGLLVLLEQHDPPKKERREAELEVAGDGEEQQRALKRNLRVET